MDVDEHEAGARLSELLRRVWAGEDVTITVEGEPVARLVSVRPQGPRQFGRDEGLFEEPDDFVDPLPPELQRAFDE